MYIGFSSPELTGPAITDYLTRVVQPLLATVAGRGLRPRSWAASPSRCGSGSTRRAWPRAASRPPTCAAAIRANNFQSAPGQAKGYFTVIDIVADTGLTDLEEFRDMVVKAADGGAGAPARRRHRRARRPEQQLVGQHERPAGRVHRRQRDADRQPAATSWPACASCCPTIQRGLPPTVAGAGRLRFDPVHPVLDRRGAQRPWSRRWRSSSS